jgi:hypothetical protein
MTANPIIIVTFPHPSGDPRIPGPRVRSLHLMKRRKMRFQFGINFLLNIESKIRNRPNRPKPTEMTESINTDDLHFVLAVLAGIFSPAIIIAAFKAVIRI